MTQIVLHHFLYSHFNEKARWALAYKGLDHRRKGVLPGPHAGLMKKLSGQTATPVASFDGEVVAGSAAIIERLEQLQPQPALYPSDANEREAALAWQRRADDHIGPDTRSIIWGALLEEPAFTARMFARDENPIKRYVYRKVLPTARDRIVRINRVTPDNIAAARERLASALEDIADAVQDTGYLVGQRFSVADLAVAALLSPLFRQDHADMRRPEPIPARILDLFEEFADQAAIGWAQDMFRLHRPECRKAA